MLKLKSLNTRDALRAAATKGCLEAVRFFMEEGVDKDAADKEGNTPASLASQKNHQAIVQVLKEFKIDKKNADMSLKLKSANTRDALRAAANKGCMGAVRFLVKQDVCQDDTDKEGRTPLMLAIQSWSHCSGKISCGASTKEEGQKYRQLGQCCTRICS